MLPYVINRLNLTGGKFKYIALFSKDVLFFLKMSQCVSWKSSNSARTRSAIFKSNRAKLGSSTYTHGTRFRNESA